MSEITAESIVAAHIDALSNLKMGETALIEPLARDAVQAAMLLGYRRANAQLEHPDLASVRENERENAARLCEEVEQIAVRLGNDGASQSFRQGEAAAARDLAFIIRQGERAKPLDNIQPPTPAQPEGDEADYREKWLTACSRHLSSATEAARLQRELNQASYNYGMELTKNTSLRNMLNASDDRAKAAEGECAELHRILETIRRVADTRP